MRLQRISKCISTLLGASALAWAAPASADGLPLNRFDPAPAGDRMFGVQSPYAAGSATPHLMLLGDYANNPLVLRRKSDDSDVGTVVGGQLFVHLNGSLSLFDRINLNIDVPLALYQGGDSPTSNGTSFNSPSGAEFGDIRAGLRVRLLGEYHDAFQLAVGGYVWLPTGKSGGFVGDGEVRGMPQLIVGGRTDRIVWSAAAGPELRSSQVYAGVDQGTMIKGGAGIGVLLGARRQFQIGPEFNVAFSTKSVEKRTTNAEALLGARYRVIRDMELGIAAGPGLTSGIGTPDFRGLLMVAYSPEQRADRDKDGVYDDVDACPDEFGDRSDDPAKNGCPAPKDRDKDGILDEIDACPDVPGVRSDDPAKNGCPLPKDRDKDGIPDDVDACPDTPGVRSDDPAKNGCPPDRDGDGIPDSADACPDLKGVASSDPKQNGCPPDTDGDGIRDDVDACKLEKGKPNPDPTKNGCPQAVRVTENAIVILQQVQFDTGKATIKKASDALLDEVAAVLTEHPEIRKAEIQGHTDDRGVPKANEKLSQDRADAVKKALVKRGIDEGRLVSRGYGQTAPIDDNKTEAGRQRNRRVEFKILEKASKGGSDAK
ncbi:OmpA family protein [Labilithrix luteola]|nr:OmpA family protein [Labilithrix luteola]